MRHIASGMEQLLKENANKLLAENLVLLKDELDAVLDEIQEEITKEKEKTEDHTVMAKEFDKVQMIEILDKLETMLKERNPQCMTLLDDIRAIAGTEDIVNDVENFDFKPAINKIRKKKEEMKNA
uniref:Uncharacterized protein n=1 Tax=uncultured bacterium contig00003 TaxID=1181495 RepID=A0A806KN57_9BACT|nr:hypothetical protein [uncultured bacterium contig00003]